MLPPTSATATPIQHVIVIIGENRTFDHVFATYKPKQGESIDNLLSKGIVNEDGTPGPNFALAAQSSAIDSSDDGFAQPLQQHALFRPASGPCGRIHDRSLSRRRHCQAIENGLPDDYYVYLTTGGTGLAHGAARHAHPQCDKLPNGPFQLTSATHPYDAYDNSPVHRFYQMWQQFDCNASTRHAQQSQRLQERPVALGRNDDRRRHQRQDAACRLQRHQPPAKARPRWASTTCSKATRPT